MTSLLVPAPKMQNRMARYKGKKYSHRFIKRINDRAKRVGAKGRLTYAIWLDSLHDANYQCKKCGRTEPEVLLTPDHIIPLSKHGDNLPGNIQVLCEPCNHKKSNKIE